MANTTNLDLVKPAGTDHALISVLNSNSDKIDAFAGQTNDSLSAEQNGLAYIVGNTNTTGGTLAVGQFVYVKGHSTIAEGLRKVTASISANASITTSNTDACSEGGLNALNSKFINTSGTIVPNTSYVENDSIICVRNGNIVIVSGIFKAKTDIPALTELFEVPFTSNNRYNISLDTVDNKNFFAYLNGTKIITQTATIPSGTWCYMNITYLKSGSI